MSQASRLAKQRPEKLLWPFCCLAGLLPSRLDIELLWVQRGIALDQNVLAGELFKIREPAGVICLENLDGFRVDTQQNIPTLKVLSHFAKFSKDFVAHCC